MCKHRYEPAGAGIRVKRLKGYYFWLCKRCNDVIVAKLKEKEDE